ncbi:Sua5/YciO/YrdC/YwlC family protein [Emticicia oligotrophica DSM 17448]|uniref:Sua5/YciO/YrdC/YwlC family protein n=1 Tax=Emticicia oligotrophica (strain DSM 17448 / CIP 109782 / MTCC 6937 / GPTSA100-15) TaxID=929562 RepID=A0ABM5N6Z3_EMTOG|nr:L-threonylcarbamoyladenylate synthase [Emticicia oligotrophica]AFK05243.1 Sua5/YciO/YrdC/YwlC family protein [Emticicia oligotrophica DSM 17448]
MSAEIIELYPGNLDERKLIRVVECLKNGGIIIYPTDTVYSMGCDIFNTKAVEKLSKIKGIKLQHNNFSIVCHDLSNISTYAKVSNNTFRLLKRALPGPFTFILPATSDLPKTLQTKRKTIGIRIPDHEIPLKIIEMLGNPIITTSVKDDIDDIQEYPNEIEVIYSQNADKVDMIIDGGWCGLEPSTVVLAVDDDFEVIREGVGDLSEFL